MYLNIFDTIRQEIRDYTEEYISPVPGIQFNTYDLIKRIHLYRLNQFEDQGLYQGMEKIFFNISERPSRMTARFLNFDLHDFRFIDKTPQDDFSTMILEDLFHQYMQNANVAQEINRMALHTADYGVTVREYDGGEEKIIPLKDYFQDPTVEYAKDSRFNIIRYRMTEYDLKKQGQENGWDMEAIERVIHSKSKAKQGDAGFAYMDEGSRNRITSVKYYNVFKRYGLVCKDIIDGSGDMDIVRSVSIVLEPHIVQNTDKGETDEKGEILYIAEHEDDYPIEDTHLNKIEGRWIGLGVYELMMPYQERYNEIINQKRVSMSIEAMHLYQSDSEMGIVNLSEDRQSGDIVYTDGVINPINTSAKNYSAFSAEEQSIAQAGDKATFTNDLLSQGAPSTLPATNAVISTNTLASVQIFSREAFALSLKNFARKHVLPDLIDSLDSEFIFRFAKDPKKVQLLINSVARKRAMKEYKKQILDPENDTIMSDEVYQMLVAREEEKMSSTFDSKAFIKILKDDITEQLENYEIDLILDNQEEDVQLMGQNIFSFLSFMMQNPQATQNPITREFIMEYGKRFGISPQRIELAEASAQMLPEQAKINQQAEPVAQEDEFLAKQA